MTESKPQKLYPQRLLIFLFLSFGVLAVRLFPAQNKVVDFVQVTTHPDIDLSPRISPDGKWMAYVSRQSGNYDIWIRSTAGGRSQQVTFHRADDFYPAWYPDSRSLVFVSQRSDAAGDIWRIKLREVKGRLFRKGKAERLTTFMGFDGYPTVSPDGKKVAWVSNRTGRDEIWFHNDNTGKTTQLTFMGGTHPCWSPDLRFIAFTSFRGNDDNNGDIYLINLKGPKPSGQDRAVWDEREPSLWQVTHGPANDGFPAWGPDARKLVFLRYDLDTNDDGVVSPRDRGRLWEADVFPFPGPAANEEDPILQHLQKSFNLRMVRYAMPLTSGAENAMQPWFGANDRIYFTSDRGGNLDIWSFPGQGHIPDIADPAAQFQLAQQTYPLPDRMTRQTLGPLFAGWQPDSLTERESKLLWDRALAFQRVIDFHGAQSSWVPASLYEIGVCYLLLGYESEARTFFGILLQSYADDHFYAAYTEMAVLGMDSKKIESESKKLSFLINGLKKIISRYSDQARPAASAQITIGDLLYEADEYTRAFGEYNKVLQNYQDERDACAESQLKIGDVFRHFASQDEVVGAYLSVVENYPDQRQWMVPARNRILDLLTKGVTDKEALIARYRDIIGQYSKFTLLAAAAQMRIADLLFQDGDYQAALQEYELVETLFPNLVDEVFEARMYQAQALLKLGESLHAFNSLEKWADEYSRDRPDLAQKAKTALLNALLQSGDYLKSNRDYELAVSRYRRAKKMAPRSAEAHRGYIESMYYLRKIDQAIAEYEQLMREHPKNNIIIYALGLAYSYKGTERVELYGDPDGLDPQALKNSSRLIAMALSYDYTFVQAYLTISYNYELMETYEARQRAKPVKFYRKAFDAVTAPIVWAYRTLTFYKESRPPRYYERAIHELTKAIALNDESVNPGLEASLALNLANNYYKLGEFGYEKAYHYYHIKLKYDSTFTDRQRQALIYTRIGHCALATKDVQKGPKYLLRAIKLYEELGNENMVLINTKRLALLYETADQNDKAVDYYQQAADIEKRNSMFSDLMRSYRSIAYNYLLLNEPQDAIQYARRALKLIEEGKVKGVKEEASRIKFGFFGLYFPIPFINLSTMGGTSAAGFTLDDERALVFTILGQSFQEQKEYSNAIRFMKQKLKIFQKRRDYKAQATFLNNIGYLYFLAGDYSQAWDYFVTSLALCEKQQLDAGILKNSINLASVVKSLREDLFLHPHQAHTEQHKKLLRQYTPIAFGKLQLALQLSETVPVSSRDHVHLLLAFAELRVLESSDRPQSLDQSIRQALLAFDNASQAMENVQKALQISKRKKMTLEECTSYYFLGKLAFSVAEDSIAYRNLYKSRRLALRYGYYDLLWPIDIALGDLVASLDRAAKLKLVVQRDAVEYYLEAIKILEAHAMEARGSISLLLRYKHKIPYQRTIRYLAGKGAIKDALTFAEQMRAKLFLDLVDNENIVLRRERHKLYYGNARFLRRNINELEIKLLRAKNQTHVSASQVAQWRSDLKAYRQEYNELLKKIRQEVPELESLVRVNPVDYREIQKNLQHDQRLYFYSFVDDSLFCWNLTTDSLYLKKLSITRDKVVATLDEIYRAVNNGESLKPYASFARQLLPDLENTDSIRNLIVIPDDELYYLPWSALVNVSFAEQKYLTIATSLNGYLLAFQNRKLQGKRIYLAGEEDLSQQLSDLGYELIRPLSLARSEDILSQGSVIGLADIIHLKLQSQWNFIDPYLSRLGYRIDPSVPVIFYLKDLFRQALSAQLVVLALDRPIPYLSGTELFLSLERAFLYAGSATLLLPIWNPEQSQEAFYSTFYQKLKTMPVSRAFTGTQQELMRKGVPAAGWAGYLLLGFGGMTEEEARQYAVLGFEGKVREGHSAFDLGEWEDAVRLYEEAFEMAQARGDERSMELLVQRILESAINGGLWEKAIEWQHYMIRMAEKKNDVEGVATGYSNLAYFYTENGQYEKGIEYKEKYARLAERYGLYEEEANSLRETGLIYERGGNYARAIEFFRQAEEKFKSIKSLRGQAQCLRDIGRIYFVYLDNYPAALKIQLKALPLFETLGKSTDYIDILQNIGLTHEKIGNYRQALDFQQRAFAMAQEMKDEQRIGLGHQYLANVYWKMGDFRNALLHQNKAIEIFTKLNDDKLLGVAFSTRGLIALSLGQIREAMSYEIKALDIATRTRNLKDQATIYKNIGLVYRANGEANRALVNFEQATEIDSSLAYKRGLTYDYRNLASIYNEINENQKALRLVRKALLLSEQLGDLRNKVQSLLVLGKVEYALGKVDSARIFLQQAAALSEKLYMPDIAWRAYKTLAEIEVADDRIASALEYYNNAIEIIEQMRARLKLVELASGFIDDKLDIYGAVVSLLYDQERYDDALFMVERSKSRSFLDMLGSRKINFARVDSTLLLKGDSLRTRLNIAQAELLQLLSKPDSSAADLEKTLQTRIDSLKQAYSRYLLKIRETNPELSGMMTVQPWSVSKIQALLADSVALIEYYYIGNQLYSWFVTSKTVRAERIILSENQLKDSVVGLRKLLERQLSVEETAQSLYDLLLQPWQSRLKETRHIIFVPHGILHYMPFAVLMNGEGEYLGLTHSISLAPSATVLGFCLQKGQRFLDVNPGSMGVLAFGNPDLGDRKFELPLASREIGSLRRYYKDVRSYLYDKATETQFREIAPYPPLLLFSCHGVFDQNNPLLSALLLAPDEKNDGRLEAHEIFTFNLDAYIVAMSACETGLGTIRGGDEVIGLSRSFIYAGASSLMSSLWKVDDLATAVLVKRFFRYLSEGNSRAEALRKAQKIVYQEINTYPGYWGAFSITGDYR